MTQPMTPETLAVIAAFWHPDSKKPWPDVVDIQAYKDIPALLAEVERLQADNEEWECAFDLEHAAISRGTEQWREANPGNELKLPSTDKLILWLIVTLDEQMAIVDKLPVTADGVPVVPGVAIWLPGYPDPGEVFNWVPSINDNVDWPEDAFRAVCADCYSTAEAAREAAEKGTS